MKKKSPTKKAPTKKLKVRAKTVKDLKAAGKGVHGGRFARPPD